MAIDVYKEWLGIPEGPRPPDHYSLLRLKQFEDAPDKIRANYKKLNAHVRKYATGQYSVESQGLLNELAKAMLCLTDLERKKEYDRGQGREFEEDQEGGRKTMGQLLIEQGVISDGQLKEATSHAEKLGLEMRDSLVQLKMVDATIAAQALAQELGLPYVDLADMHPDDAVLDQVPRETVKQHSILPLFIDEEVLLVACTSLIGPELEDELRMRFNIPIRTALAAPQAINQGISKYYAPGMRNAAPEPAPAADGKEKKKGKEKAKPAAAAKPQATRKTALTPEEIKQRKQYGGIAFCWSFVLGYVLDWYVVSPGRLDGMSAVFFGLIPAITGAIVWVTCFKK